MKILKQIILSVVLISIYWIIIDIGLNYFLKWFINDLFFSLTHSIKDFNFFFILVLFVFSIGIFYLLGLVTVIPFRLLNTEYDKYLKINFITSLVIFLFAIDSIFRLSKALYIAMEGKWDFIYFLFTPLLFFYIVIVHIAIVPTRSKNQIMNDLNDLEAN